MPGTINVNEIVSRIEKTVLSFFIVYFLRC